jgi:peptide/nickel transport system permease protein
MEKNKKKRNEFLYFTFRNNKLRIGLLIVVFFLVMAIIGPSFTENDPLSFIHRGAPLKPFQSEDFLFGTTVFGQDVYSQFVHGLRATFVVGAIGGGLATLIGVIVGFVGGYVGGKTDEGLNMGTNIVLVIPTLAVLLIISAYLEVRGILLESIFIGCTAWPWTARAVRAQTFSLRAREFVDLAKMTGMKSLKIIFKEIAPNMMSYLLLVFILQFGGATLNAATLDFIGLGPTEGISLGLMMNHAVAHSALLLDIWWWFIPPGFAITAIVGALYVTNVGLDEVFNPKLREM